MTTREIIWWYNKQALCMLCKKPVGYTDNRGSQTHDDCWDLRFQPKIARCCDAMYKALCGSWIEWNRKENALALYNGEYGEFFSPSLKSCPWCFKPIDNLDDNPFFESSVCNDGYKTVIKAKWLETGQDVRNEDFE